MRDVKRKFATILAFDCVGFSKHMLENEEKTLDSLNACREIIDGFIEKHGGRIFTQQVTLFSRNLTAQLRA